MRSGGLVLPLAVVAELMADPKAPAAIAVRLEKLLLRKSAKAIGGEPAKRAPNLKAVG